MMKEFKVLFLLVFLIPFNLYCQVNEGVISYSAHTICNWQEYFKGEPEMQQYATTFPDTITDFYSLYFSKTESYFQQKDTIVQKNSILEEYGIWEFTEVFTDLDKRVQIESDNVMGQELLIVDSLDKLNNTVTILSEQENIAGYTCIKALLKIGAETVEIWFTPQIPVSLGPWRVQGLPGMVLKTKFYEVGVVYTIVATSVKTQKNSNLDEMLRTEDSMMITREKLFGLINDR